MYTLDFVNLTSSLMSPTPTPPLPLYHWFPTFQSLSFLLKKKQQKTGYNVSHYLYQFLHNMETFRDSLI